MATPEEVTADQITGYRVVCAAERQSNAGSKGKGYSLDLSRLRWQPLPGTATATASTGGATTGGGSSSGNGGSTPGGNGNGEDEG